MPLKTLAIHASKNTGTKKDASGAFVPEAVRHAKLYGGRRVPFDNLLGLARRRASVHAILAEHHDLDHVAVFGHGLRGSLQTGHTIAQVGELADAIAQASREHVTVFLAACSTASQLSVERGGFADALADALAARGKRGWVDAHTTAGHTTKNPYVQRFHIGRPVELLAGVWIVPPGSELWATWRRLLSTTDLRLRFSAMLHEDILAELRAKR